MFLIAWGWKLDQFCINSREKCLNIIICFQFDITGPTTASFFSRYHKFTTVTVASARYKDCPVCLLRYHNLQRTKHWHVNWHIRDQAANDSRALSWNAANICGSKQHATERIKSAEAAFEAAEAAFEAAVAAFEAAGSRQGRGTGQGGASSLIPYTLALDVIVGVLRHTGCCSYMVSPFSIWCFWNNWNLFENRMAASV